MDCFFVQTPLLLGQLIVLTDNPEVKVALPREGSFCPTEKTCVSMAKGLRKGMYFFVMTTFNPNKPSVYITFSLRRQQLLCSC